MDGNKVTSSTYRGQHTHDAPQLTKLSAHDQQSFKRSVAIENQKAPFGPGLSFAPGLVVADPNRQQARLVIEADEHVDAMDDGYSWRKYGQKVVKGTPFPRSYYRCTFPGCNVKKQVRRQALQVVNSYEGVHSHAAPNSAAAAAHSEHKRPRLAHHHDDALDNPMHGADRVAAQRKIEIPDSRIQHAPVVPLTPTSRGSNTPRGSIAVPQEDHSQYLSEVRCCAYNFCVMLTSNQFSNMLSPHMTFADLSRTTPHELQLFIPSYDGSSSLQSAGVGGDLIGSGGQSLQSPHYSSSPLGSSAQFQHLAMADDQFGHQQPVAWMSDK